MKHLRFLSLFVLLIGANASGAEDVDDNLCMNVHGTYSTCIEKLADDNGNNSCGDNCMFKVIEENGKQVLHIYKKDISKPATILEGAFSPNRYKGKQVLDASGIALPLNNIVIDNDFENFGYDTFAGSGAHISSANGKFVFNSGERYFATTSCYMCSDYPTLNGDVEFSNQVNQAVEHTKINGDVMISDNVKNITPWSFENTTINGNLILPDTIQKIGQHAFRYLDITGNIYCASGTEVCYEMIKQGCENEVSCINSLNDLLESGKFSDYPEGCISLSVGASCTKCKNENYVLEDGLCYRRRYTLPEADEATSDDNENMIEWIFE